MKKLFISCAALFVFLAVNAPVKAEPVYGFIYKNSTEAGEGLSNVAASKKGSATCTSYFGIVGVGPSEYHRPAREPRHRGTRLSDTSHPLYRGASE